MNLITIVGLLLTVIGLVATIWALYLARSQTKDVSSMQGNMETQLRQLESIQKALTTRFIGPFPDYIPRIVSLIESAEKEIIIFCDVPAYGCFRAHDHHVKYRQAIERKILDNDKKSIQLTFLNEEWRLRALLEQYPFEGDEWNKMKKDKGHLLAEFLVHYGDENTSETLTKDTFLDLIEKLNLRILNQEFSSKAKEVSVAMPVIFWLVDNKEAVFAVPAYEQDIVTLGFSTSDQSLIAAFKEMSKRYRQMYVKVKVNDVNSNPGVIA